MAKFKVLTDFCIDTGRDVVAGDVVELEPRRALGYMQQGRLVEVADETPAKAAKKEAAETAEKSDEAAKSAGKK